MVIILEAGRPAAGGVMPEVYGGVAALAGRRRGGAEAEQILARDRRPYAAAVSMHLLF